MVAANSLLWSSYSLQHWGFVVFTEKWGPYQEIRLQYQWTEERTAPGSAVQKQLFTQFCLRDLLLYRLSWPDCHGPITAKRGRASETTLYTSTHARGIKNRCACTQSPRWWFVLKKMRFTSIHQTIHWLSHMFNAFSMCRACPCGEKDHDKVVCQLVVGGQVW